MVSKVFKKIKKKCLVELLIFKLAINRKSNKDIRIFKSNIKERKKDFKKINIRKKTLKEI